MSDHFPQLTIQSSGPFWVRYRACNHEIDYVTKSQWKSKSHYVFKCYSNLAGVVDFACCWNYIAKGLRLYYIYIYILQFAFKFDGKIKKKKFKGITESCIFDQGNGWEQTITFYHDN